MPNQKGERMTLYPRRAVVREMKVQECTGTLLIYWNNLDRLFLNSDSSTTSPIDLPLPLLARRRPQQF